MAPKMKKLKSMDNGMAMPTKSALRKPKKNISTKTTSNTPKMMEFSNSPSWLRVRFDWSLVTEIFTSSGKTSACASAKMTRILSDTAIKFSPPRLTTSNVTTGLVYSREYDSFSTSPKDTSAMSLR